MICVLPLKSLRSSMTTMSSSQPSKPTDSAASDGLRHCDVFIVGGGINGAGIARDAAGRGYRVSLCDSGDFGSGTSSASTKLIHGGLRYLEHYKFRLVAESLRERERLLQAAPSYHPAHAVFAASPQSSPATLAAAFRPIYLRSSRRPKVIAQGQARRSSTRPSWAGASTAV